MTDGPNERRLAAILAVDLAGYSAQSEADEAAAVRTVESIRRLVLRSAADHGGRVFNIAGDGFLTEFPTPSGALAAADAIVRGAELPVRIGAHVGEVAVTQSGDLLGHGVNVACRLQALAEPGGVLVSETLRRTLGGAPAPKLRRIGRVRLEKMQEVHEVHCLAGFGGLNSGTPRHWPVRLGLAALGLALVVAFLVALAQSGSPDLRVAVAPLAARTGGSLEKWLAGSLPGSIVTALSDREVLSLPPSRWGPAGRGGARMLVGGDVERTGETLRIRLRLEDRRSDAILWSGVFERPVSEMDALQAQVSAKVADLASLSSRALGERANKLDTETLAAFLRIADQQRSGTVNAVRTIALHRRVIEKAPDFALGHASLAFALAVSAPNMPEAVAAQMRGEAEREAGVALKLDPRCGDAYSALLALASDQAPAAREAILLKGLAVEPQNGSLNNYQADLLRGVGRLREARPYHVRALQLDPLSPGKTATNIFALAGTGKMSEAEALLDRSFRLFPDYPGLGRAAVYTQTLYGSPDKALAALERHARSGGPIEPGAAPIWRDYIIMRRDGRTNASVLARMRAAANSGLVDPSAAMGALSLAGDTDGALAVVEAALDREAAIYPADLFENATRAMRRDPRFMRIAARTGAAEYWLKTGKMPDFCAEPDLGYDCRAEAARAVAELGR